MDLQSLIDSQLPNTVLDLSAGEFFGQVTIGRPITIVGHGKSTWIGSRKSPAIKITSPCVKLQNLMIELTSSPEGVVVEAVEGTNPVLQDVVVMGMVVGIPPQNIINAAEIDSEDSVSISFLPPPPMSPTDADQGKSIHVPCSGNRPISSSPSSPLSQAPDMAVPSRSLSGWKIATVLLSIILGLVLAMQYRDQGMKISKQIEKERQEKELALARVKALEQERDHALRKARELKLTTWSLGIDVEIGSSEGEGVRIKDIRPDGAGARMGLGAGDVILEVDGKAVRNISTFNAAVAEAKWNISEVIRLKVKRGAANIFLATAIE